MKNYRLTFGGEDIDYESNFAECRKYYPIIFKMMDIAKYYDARIWWFFEPYAEVTWICDDDESAKEMMKCCTDILKKHNLKYKKYTPKNGIFADWYCKTPKEREFTTARYAACAKQARLFIEAEKAISRGHGLENQYARSAHVLANQLAMNYADEGRILMQRGLLALSFFYAGHEKAVALYNKIFKNKYK